MVRRHAFAILFIAVVVLAIFLPALVKSEVFTFRDHHDYFQPLRFYTALYLSTWNLPYWNPYSASGEPWLANPQTGAFYPPTWLFIFLHFEMAYMLHLALHLTILGWGAYALFVRSAGEGPALVGALALVFCGPVISLLDVSNNLATFAWVPWVIWCGLERRPRIAAVMLAMAFLGGEPFFAACAALIYVVVVRDVRQMAIAGLGAFGLSAIQLLPFLEMLRGSDRAARLSSEQILRDSMNPLDWLRLAVPPSLSNTGFDANLSQHFIPVIYVGIAVVILALAGVITSFRKRATWGWVALIVAAIIISAGAYLPLAGELVARAPLTLFRYPSRVVPFGALAIAALAASGWARFRPNRRWIDLVIVMIVLVDLVPRLGPLLHTAPFDPMKTEYTPLIGRAAKMLRVAERPPLDRSAWIAGYANLYHKRFDAATASPVMNDTYMRLHDAAVRGGDLSLLNLMSVGYVFAERVLPPLKPLQTVRGVTVLVNPYARPQAEYRSRVREFATHEDALRATIAGAERDVVPVSGGRARSGGANAPASAAVGFIAMDARHARVVVEAPDDGIVLITQQDAPGWRVYVDGKESEKLNAYGVFRAVSISRGRRDVRWEYTPRSLHFGAAMTIVTALLIQLSAFVKRSEHRKFSS
jgi:hypothetical protein